MESMRGAYADHVEFCALSGNEARALELLAERPAYFTDSGDPRSKLDFMAVTALLMDRLTGLGLGDQAVPGPAGREWTASGLAVHARGEALSLAALFDARNGTSYVSERVRGRMDQRPLVERLPLGVRSRSARHLSPSGSAAGSGSAAASASASARSSAAFVESDAGSDPSSLPALLAEARRLSATRSPDAVEAWAAVSRAAEGQELDVRDRAEIADHAAMERGPEGIELFHEAAALYAEAGDPGEALAARARAAYVLALTGGPEEALARVSELYEGVLALLTDGGTGVSQAASVLVGRARILMLLVQEDADEGESGATASEGTASGTAGSGTAADEVVGAAEAAVRELLALAEPHLSDVRMASRAAEARAMLGELAAHAGDAEAAAELLGQAAAAFVAAGLPWFAVEYESRLAGIARHLGDAEEAERAARAALEHGGPRLEPMGHAQLHLQLAEVLGATGQFGPASEHALEAAHWADEAGEGPTLGAWARHQLGGFLLRQGRWAEGAEILESALPDLTTDMHGDGAIVQTRWWLGDCLTELGEHRAAAEHWLRAADVARHWPEQRDHAMLAHLAAEALGHAELPAQAEQAYVRAGDLWRDLGNVHGRIRSLRARAWVALRTDSGLDGARESMAAAVRECEEGLRAVSSSVGAEVVEASDAVAGSDAAERRHRLVAELGHTHRQFGDLVARSVPDDAEEALAHYTRAISVFASLGEDALDARTGAELAAGWLEADLLRPAAATARARAVLSAYTGRDGEAAQARRAEAENMLGMTEKA
jgi:tetratricopeptide (TPR) repeat protein